MGSARRNTRADQHETQPLLPAKSVNTQKTHDILQICLARYQPLYFSASKRIKIEIFNIHILACSLSIARNTYFIKCECV